MSGLPGGEQLITLLDEFNEGETLESKVAHDADMLSQICLQREYVSEKDFKRWHKHTVERLETDSGKELASVIANASPMDWLYAFAEKLNNK